MDLRGFINKYQYQFELVTYYFVWSPIIRLKCFLKKIFIGDKCRFYGNAHFYRRPNSSITIGNECGFRSIFKSNLIGINRKCMISTLAENAEIKIGNKCGFSGTVISAAKSIILGDKVRCGANTLITDNDWHLDDHRSGEPKEITIEDNVWLGVNVVVLKGVTIGKNSVIGANSIVVKNIPDNVYAAGNPCIVLKEIRIL